MIEMTSTAVCEFLESQGMKPTLQKETQQIYMQFTIAQKPFPLFIRVFDNEQLLQIIVFFPFLLEDHAIADMARLLHLLNKELDLPGFGMDEMEKAIFFRVMLPAPSNKIDPMNLLTYIQTCERICNSFSDPIQAIGAGLMNLNDILEKTLHNKPERE